jgi:hypothetical protein
MRSVALTVLLAVVLAGCAHVERSTPQPRPRPKDGAIAVLSLAPQHPFLEIGILEVTVNAQISRSQVLDALQKAARELGADAIVLGDESLVGLQTLPGTAGTIRHRATAIAFIKSEELRWDGPLPIRGASL